MSSYGVKGSSIQSKLQYVREAFGEKAEERLRSSHPDLGRAVLKGSWYPFELYDQLLQTIATNHFGGFLQRLEAVGEHSAEVALSTTYKAFAVAKDLPGLVRRLSTLHGMYYDKGSMRLGDFGDSHLTVVLSGAPVYSKADLHVASGFYVGAAKVIGMKGVRSTINLGDDGAEIKLRW